MIQEPPASQRALHSRQLEADLTVVGGGMAGTCCAIMAARFGLKVVLVQDRPVLGGNASSEVRLWILGATVHSLSNNRWAREGGVINEIMTENLWRNPEGNPLIFDTVVLEKVVAEKNLTLLLNTACFEVAKDPSRPDRIASVKAFCSQNSTLYEIRSPLFCDASGDGIVGFLAGAAFRMGAESKEEFGEGFAPTGEFGHLLGHSIYFYSKDAGRPVKFVPPSFALADIEGKIPRYRQFNTKTQGCQLWWIEYGGRLDTVHGTEEIKWELWKVVYGVWDYIKNSGKFPEAANLTLEWIGQIPGKRESRRFEGDYILRQQDIVERRIHEDAAAHGGWSIDLHPADGVFAEIAGSHHLHSKGVYQIPYRCFYSRNIENLFLAGRIISASHVAFGSTRVIATCAVGAQAVAAAAALCKEHQELPREIGGRIEELQRKLLRVGHFIPGVTAPDPDDLIPSATVTASSTLELASLPPDGPLFPLDRTVAQMIPWPKGPLPRLTFLAEVDEPASLEIELRTTSGPLHQTPDVTLDSQVLSVKAGTRQEVLVHSRASMPQAGYLFLIVKKHPGVRLLTSALRVTGLLRTTHAFEPDYTAVGGDRYDVFETGMAGRRDRTHNLAFTIDPPIALFGPENLRNGLRRPIAQPNAWVADPRAEKASLRFSWPAPQRIGSIELHFDGDFEHSMESVLAGHPERAVVFGVKRYQILDARDEVLTEADNCHHSLVTHHFDPPAETDTLTVRVLETWGAPPAIFEVRCYSPASTAEK
jgi:hypothetical protein